MEFTEELPVQRGYALWSASYDDDGNPLLALEGPIVRERFGPIAGRRALDLGCGTGRHTLALAEAGAQVFALDLTPEMLARAKTKLDGLAVTWLRHALPDALPFREASFALAVLGLVAEHVADLVRLFSETARVLEPGGRCILSALHPDRTAEGQCARFIDPASGRRRPVTTYHRTVDDYLLAARTAGLVLEDEQSLMVPLALAEQLPRAEPYVGKALGWVACWSRESSQRQLTRGCNV
jgi:malonyl-CoA O-methyltransferase